MSELQHGYHGIAQHVESPIGYISANDSGGTAADSERAIAAGFCQVPATMYSRYGKRALEVALVILLLPMATMLIALCALLIKMLSPGPVFYRQERVGQGGQLFGMLKLRTMVPGAENTTGPVWAAEDDPRVTWLGRWLRKARIDELPQLVHVLTGQMALIGPRPERPQFVRQFIRYLPCYPSRLSVRPGITGWAQVNHGYDNCFGDVCQKLWYDLYYIRHLSLKLDILILCRTLGVLFRGNGAR